MLSQKLLLSAAGAAAADRIYVDDVFSTFLYDGTSSAQTITNGIDLDGEGGMVWIKGRSNGTDGMIWDTERGVRKYLRTNSDLGEATSGSTAGLIQFNSDGFGLGSNWNTENFSSYTYASWTFRKCPKFFDIVTYTGNGSNRTISHNLGSVPGSIWIKQTNAQNKWSVYHRAADATNPSHFELHLSENEAPADEGDVFNDTEPTSTVFTVGTNSGVNGSGNTYVAYLFAHNEQSFGANGDEAIIHCGTYTSNESTNGVEVNLGFEPQWVLIKRTNSAGNWVINDTMRGFSARTSTVDPANGDRARFLFANTGDAEQENRSIIGLPNGFKVTSTSVDMGKNNASHVYIAIAKPNKPPTTGSEVFNTDLGDNTYTNGVEFFAGFPVDMYVARNITAAGSSDPQHRLYMRKYQASVLITNRVEDANGHHTPSVNQWSLDNNHGAYYQAENSDNCAWMWRTAPGFFDVTNYWNGDDTNNRTINHNLRAVPKMMWIKSFKDADSIDRGWCVYHESLGNTKKLVLNTSAAATNTSDFSSTSPTATNFTVGAEVSVNKNAEYIALMFGEVEGVSKIGSYTGNGTNQNIDCGFSAGARFILIKRTDASGDWCQFDTERGINAGTEEHDAWNSNTNTKNNDADSIDTYSAGFNVVQNSTSNLNVSSATYIFYAIS